MNESPIKWQGNLAYEDDDKPTSLKSFHLKKILNQTEESGHSSHDHHHVYEELNREKAKPAQGSNRTLFVVVIAVCLISLLALLLTVLMLVGKIGISNEVKTIDYDDSLLAKVKALEENITSLQLGLTDAWYDALRDDLNMTRNQPLTISDTVTKDSLEAVNTTLTLRVENLNSAVSRLKFVLNRTSTDLGAEINSTKIKTKPSAHIVASYVRGVNYSSNTVIKDWSTSDPHSHLEGGMKYEHGKLTVPKAGRYYIYAHLQFSSKGKVQILVNDDVVSLIKSPVKKGDPAARASGSGVFVLNAGDSISLRINPSGASGNDTVKLWMQYKHSYFGAFLI